MSTTLGASAVRRPTLLALLALSSALACSKGEPLTPPTAVCVSPCACDLTTICDGDACTCDPECGACRPPSTAAADAGGADGAVTAGGDSGASEEPSGRTPIIQDFNSNVFNIVEGSTVEYTLEVLDRDGAADVVEAFIETRDGHTRVTDLGRVSSEGDTSVFGGSMSWDQLYGAEPFSLVDGELTIFLTGVAVDAAGNRASRDLSLSTTCNFGEWGQVCGGRCVSMYGDRNHCGGCGMRCTGADTCRMASCGSPTGWSSCFAETAAESCDAYCQGQGLSCSNSCGFLSGTREVNGVGGDGYLDANCRTSPHTEYDPARPDFRQTPAVCSTRFSDWPQASALTHFKCCCR